MSPKNNSLAYEELIEEVGVDFTPELNLIIPKRMYSTKVQLESLPISIRGSITVSF